MGAPAGFAGPHPPCAPAVRLVVVCVFWEQGILHHLGRTDRLDICLLIPVLRFQQTFGVDTDVVAVTDLEKLRQEKAEVRQGGGVVWGGVGRQRRWPAGVRALWWQTRCPGLAHAPARRCKGGRGEGDEA
jgi:hypothetical protein